MTIATYAIQAAGSAAGGLELDCPVQPDVQDWNRLYRLHARPLFRFLLKLTYGDRNEAEDFLQETFLRTWRWVQHHPLDIETMRPWLFTVARRIVIDATRARQVRPIEVVIEDVTTLAASENDIDRLVQGQAVRRALLTLREEHRSALIELFYHDRTAKEAASVLGIPEGTVKSRAHYALRALRSATVAADRENVNPRRMGSVNPARPTRASPGSMAAGATAGMHRPR